MKIPLKVYLFFIVASAAMIFSACNNQENKIVEKEWIIQNYICERDKGFSPDQLSFRNSSLETNSGKDHSLRKLDKHDLDLKLKKNWNSYFLKEFYLPESKSLELQVSHKHGISIYLNGKNIYRSKKIVGSREIAFRTFSPVPQVINNRKIRYRFNDLNQYFNGKDFEAVDNISGYWDAKAKINRIEAYSGSKKLNLSYLNKEAVYLKSDEVYIDRNTGNMDFGVLLDDKSELYVNYQILPEIVSLECQKGKNILAIYTYSWAVDGGIKLDWSPLKNDDLQRKNNDRKPAFPGTEKEIFGNVVSLAERLYFENYHGVLEGNIDLDKHRTIIREIKNNAAEIKKYYPKSLLNSKVKYIVALVDYFFLDNIKPLLIFLEKNKEHQESISEWEKRLSDFVLENIKQNNALSYEEKNKKYFGLLSFVQEVNKKEKLQKGLNIIWIVVDCLRADRLGIYGYKKDTSPNIDNFAKNCILFLNAYSAFGTTVPSVDSMFLSKYSPSFEEKNVTLAEILKKNGYLTAIFTANPLLKDPNKHGRGMDFIFDIPSRKDSVKPQIQDINNHVINFLSEENRKSNLFIYVHAMDVHAPYIVPDEFVNYFYQKEYKGDGYSVSKIEGCLRGSEEKYPVEHHISQYNLTKQDLAYFNAMYDGCIKYTDYHLNYLLGRLRLLGMMENSIIVISADHGEALFEHGWWEHGRNNWYNEDIKIPLLIYLPGVQKREIDTSVSSIDIMPTILDLLGIKISKKIDGISLKKLIFNKERIREENIFGDRGGYVISDRWKYINRELILDDILGRVIVKSRKLFDLTNDIYEKNNLVFQFPEIAQRLEKTIIRRFGLELSAESNFNILKNTTRMDEKTLERLKSLGYIK